MINDNIDVRPLCVNVERLKIFEVAIDDIKKIIYI